MLLVFTVTSFQGTPSSTSLEVALTVDERQHEFAPFFKDLVGSCGDGPAIWQHFVPSGEMFASESCLGPEDLQLLANPGILEFSFRFGRLPASTEGHARS